MNNTIALSDLVIEDRQRKEISPAHIADLKRSILTKGLMHPVVGSWRVKADGITQEVVLIAGECRTRAMLELHEEGIDFCYNGVKVAPGRTPITYLQDLSVDDIMEAELEENIFRLALTWQEETEAKAKIHLARKNKNSTQTQMATAREIASKTGNKPDTERISLQQALLIQEHKNNPDLAPRIKKARSSAEAVRIILDDAEAKMKAKLAIQAEKTDASVRIQNGDALELIKTLPADLIDTIITDPPYGISADQQGKDAKHYYDDSADYALNFCKTIISEGFRITKNRAILFMFCDVEHFTTLRDYAQQHAWTTWRTPLIWTKGFQGSAPWGRAGFVRTYETILFAVKGRKELTSPGGPDVFDFSRVARGERVHAAEKPVELLSFLLERSTLAGEIIFDPCCGSGNIILAARKHKCDIVTFEKDPSYYAEAVQKTTIDLTETKTTSLAPLLEDI